MGDSTCKYCGGYGDISFIDANMNGNDMVVVDACPSCHGSGRRRFAVQCKASEARKRLIQQAYDKAEEFLKCHKSTSRDL